MEAKCLDISRKVFNNDTSASLYVIKSDNNIWMEIHLSSVCRNIPFHGKRKLRRN